MMGDDATQEGLDRIEADWLEGVCLMGELQLLEQGELTDAEQVERATRLYGQVKALNDWLNGDGD